MRALCALLGALAAFVSVSARAQVDDPLYPLDIGAVWEFEADSWSMMHNTTSSLHRERARSSLRKPEACCGSPSAG